MGRSRGGLTTKIHALTNQDVIPPKANRRRPAAFDAKIYHERNKIERFFGRLKASFRRIATRYEKTSANFMAMIKLASVRLWCQFYESAA